MLPGLLVVAARVVRQWNCKHKWSPATKYDGRYSFFKKTHLAKHCKKCEKTVLFKDLQEYNQFFSHMALEDLQQDLVYL